MAGNYKRLPMDGYDPSKPLAKIEREQYVHAIIAHGGNKKKAFEEVYNNGEPLPREKANYPYAYFKGKQIRARYDYILNQHLQNVGIDSKSMLIKSAKLMEQAVLSNDIDGFTKMVNTVLKIKGEGQTKVITMSSPAAITHEDNTAIEALFEKL